MAIGSVIHTFAIQLADVDRGRYEEGIVFGGGVSTADEPAVHEHRIGA